MVLTPEVKRCVFECFRGQTEAGTLLFSAQNALKSLQPYEGVHAYGLDM